MTVTETPSAVFHYSAVQDSCNSKHTDAIVEAAKKDLSTLMKLDVSKLQRELALLLLFISFCQELKSGFVSSACWRDGLDVLFNSLLKSLEGLK